MTDAPVDSPTVYCRRCRRTIPRSSATKPTGRQSSGWPRWICGGALTESCLKLAAEHAKQANAKEPEGIRPLGASE